jgi:hypothetical protein
MDIKGIGDEAPSPTQPLISRCIYSLVDLDTLAIAIKLSNMGHHSQILATLSDARPRDTEDCIVNMKPAQAMSSKRLPHNRRHMIMNRAMKEGLLLAAALGLAIAAAEALTANSRTDGPVSSNVVLNTPSIHAANHFVRGR